MDPTKLYDLRATRLEAFDKAMAALDAYTEADITARGAAQGVHISSYYAETARLAASDAYSQACQVYVEAVEAYEEERAKYVSEE